MTTTQLQRELLALENELRLTRNRLGYLQNLGEHDLATDAQRILLAQEVFKDSLTLLLQAPHGSHPAPPSAG